MEDNTTSQRETVSRKENVNFLNFLVKEVPYDYKLKKLRVRKSPHDSVGFEVDDGHRFRNTVSITKTGTSTIQSFTTSSRNSEIREFLRRRQLEQELKKQYEASFGNAGLPTMMPVELVEWEKSVNNDRLDSEGISTVEYINELINSGWEKNIFMDPEANSVYKPWITLWIDDPNLIFEKVEEKKTKTKKKAQKVGTPDKPVKNKFNISNDRYYAVEVKGKQSLGTFGVQHSMPALRLDTRFYKTNHSLEELRNLHRPPCCIGAGTYKFKGISSSKFSGNVLKRSSELTLSDATPFRIFEYFEEFPFFVVNPGMVSLLNTYYRKTEPADEPATDGCIVLDMDEDAPFFGYGEIRAGTYLETLANNLFIAPTYAHKSTDFLCVLLQDNEIQMRPIDTVNLIGQEFPKEEVYTPHSRKLNQFCKDRLKVAAYRLFSKGKDLQMQQLDTMFPYFSEGSKRKWLKEYSDYVKKGKENVWVLKDSFAIVGEEDLRRLVTPENICQYESMLAEERRMEDLGYKCHEDGDDDEDYDTYAPNWYLSKNFVNAAGGKGLLELTGAGDTFSFRKIKLKKGNESENRKIVAEHQATYKERVTSIWGRHIELLCSSEPVEYTAVVAKPSVEVASETTATEMVAGLTIERTVEEDGMIVKRVERVYDSRVIKAYLKAKRSMKIDEKDKKSTFTCSSCGQTGHMRTNKTCPNYVGSLKALKKKAERKKASQVLQDKLLRLVSHFMATPFSNAFHRPVSLKKFPNYTAVVKNPIDLGTIRMNVKNGQYKKYSEFLEDLCQMKDNCGLYNGMSHSLTEIANGIYNLGVQYFQENGNEIKMLEFQIENERVLASTDEYQLNESP